MSTVVDKKPAVLEVIFSLAFSVFFLGATFALVAFRAVRRYRALNTYRRRVRFDAAQHRARPEEDARRRVVESSAARARLTLEEPPQFHRRPPPVLRGHDARTDCAQMLDDLRGRLNAPLPSMRIALSHLRGLLPPSEAARFLHTYEAVMFGPPDGYVSAEDLRQLRIFFSSTILAAAPSAA